jgi:hypothetical protein
MKVFGIITDAIIFLLIASAFVFVSVLFIEKYLPPHYQRKAEMLTSASARVCKVCFALTIAGLFIYLIILLIELHPK